MIIIKNIHVYAPEDLGIKDVFVEGEKIKRIAPHIEWHDNQQMTEVIDGTDLILTPGLIDLHEHITGGGGEGGFARRCPEADIAELIRAGVTSVVGLLGTDGITRTLPNLVAKTKELREEGISAWCLCGSYGYPPVTLTGSVESDIVLIEEMIGVKTSLSDHRSSAQTDKELIALGTAGRRAGLLSHKAGFVTIHMGDGKQGLKPLFKARNASDIPITTFLPTHMARNAHLLEEGMQWIKAGGFIDITAGADEKEQESTTDAITKVIKAVGGSQLTVTSDAYGSLPVFDEKGSLISLSYVTPKILLEQIKSLCRRGISLPDALELFTGNPAKVLKKDDQKGRIHEQYDADLLIMDQNLNLLDVIAKGAFLMQNRQVLKQYLI